ncbi:MAG: Ig-like domain repeat protein [Acidobacteria bacterium]|nr:Ig-like domain repeat protein [Acidobacteriota bacterium]
MKPRIAVLLLLLIVALPGAGGLSRAATLTVTSTADSGAGSLRNTIAAAASGDTLQFGFASGTITLTSGSLTVNKSLTITGLGADKLTVSGNSVSRVFDVTSGTVTLSGMKITAGHVSGYYSGGANGAGLRVAAGATVTVDACWFLSNTANYAGEFDPCGGAIYNQGTLTVTAGTFSGNSACGGSAVANDGTAAFTNCTFSGNSAQFGGAVLNLSGTTTLLNCTVAGNTIVANDNGGGLNLYNGSIALRNTLGAQNSAAVGNARVDLDDNWGGTGTFQSQGYNLVGDLGQYAFSGNTTGDRYGDPLSSTTPNPGAVESGTAIDPLLSALDTGLAQGGTTPTRPLQSGSPAIDNGTAAGAPEKDQRGYNRSGNTDIGAFEFNGTLQDPTTTALTSAPNPSAWGQSVTLTATVTSSGGTPTGTVTFFDGAANLGTGALNGSGVAALTTAALAVGTHALTATYSGSTGFGASTSPVHSHAVNPLPTATVVTAAPNPSLFGQPVTITATVSAAAGTPTGTVQFTADGANLGGPVPLSGGTASLGTSSLSVGGHPVSAQYLPDTPAFAGSTGSLSGGQTVNKANTSTILVSSQNPSRFGQSVTFTATVTSVAPGGGVPSGTVTFTDNGAFLGSGTLNGSGTATFTTASLGVATHPIRAEYAGSGSHNGSLSSHLNQVVQPSASFTSLAASPNPSVSGQPVSFTATVTAVAPGAGTPSGTVTFLDNGSAIGTGSLDGSGTVTFNTSSLAVGTHLVIAQYGGDAAFDPSPSTPLTQTVQKAGTTTAVTSMPNPSTYGQPATFTATVTAVAPGAGTPTGTVTFLDGAATLGTGTLIGGVATFSTGALAVGAHTVTARYDGDALFEASTSPVLSQAVNQADTTTGLASAPNPSRYGQSVTFTATVTVNAPGAGTPTGTVTFHDGATTLGTGTLAGGAATFTTAALGVGPHTMTAVYVGDASFNPSTSTPLTQTVQKADTTTSLGAAPNPSRVGQPVTFTATVTVNAPGSGAPTGTVTFLEGATTLGTGTLAGGAATLTTAALGVGPHTVTARYDGDAAFNPSTSPAGTQTVQKADTTTGLNAAPNPSVYGQAVTFTATVAVTAPGAGTPTGTVTFLEGATTLGTGTLSGGTATFTTPALGVGPHTVTARYDGDPSFNPSTSAPLAQDVQKANTTTGLNTAPNPSVYGQAVTFTATVAVTAPGAGTPTGTVTFLDGATTLGTGTLSGDTATFTNPTLSVATHTVTARYDGDAAFNPSTSSAVNQTVDKAETTTALVSAPNPSVFGQAVTFTATVAVSAPGAGTPTGTVTFLEGATTLGTGTLSGTTATFTAATLAAGPHAVTARYDGDAAFNTSTSSAVNQTVNKADTATALTSSPNPSVFGQAVTFTATVTAVAPGTGTPAGTVTFLDGATTLGTGALAGGTATFTTAALAVATHPVTARYEGDPSFNTSTSTILDQGVQKADSTAAVASSANPSAWGQSVTFTATVTAAAPGAGTPTGAVTFLDGAATLGTAALDGSGVASFSTSALEVATHPVTVSYGGDGHFNGSTSGVLSQVVNPAGTATALALSASPVCEGEPVTFTATVTVTAPGAGTPTGTVTFYDDAVSLGTGTLDGAGTAVLTTAAMAPGARTVSAAYGGDAHFGASTSPGAGHTVNPLPTPLITGPATVCLGSDVTLDAGADYAAYHWSPGGETTRAITVSPAAATAYTVTVTTAAGCTATSPDHTVTVLSVTEITAMPLPRTIWAGQAATLSVLASGETLHYQWYRGVASDVSEPVGGDANTFTTPALAETTPYWVQVTGGCGPADSVTAWVTVRQVASHAVVDFDANGISDVFWRNDVQDVTSAWLLENDGAIVGLYLGGSGDGVWEVKGLNDFTGDGPDDVLWRNRFSGELSMWILGKGGVVADESPGEVDPAWQIVGTGDVNADGMADLFWRNDELGLLSLWFMDGAAVKGSLDLGGVGSVDWQVVGTADFDGSGTADLFWRHGPTGAPSIWLLNDRGFAADVSPGPMDPAWHVLGFGDVDRDGCADVLWRNAETGALSLWLINAGGLQRSIDMGTVSDLNWKVMGVGDFNGDGRADLLWRNMTTGTLAFWYLHEKGIVGNPSPGAATPDWQTLNHVILNVFPAGGGKGDGAPPPPAPAAEAAPLPR